MTDPADREEIVTTKVWREGDRHFTDDEVLRHRREVIRESLVEPS
jgi:hypothetical protein